MGGTPLVHRRSASPAIVQIDLEVSGFAPRSSTTTAPLPPSFGCAGRNASTSPRCASQLATFILSTGTPSRERRPLPWMMRHAAKAALPAVIQKLKEQRPRAGHGDAVQVELVLDRTPFELPQGLRSHSRFQVLKVFAGLAGESGGHVIAQIVAEILACIAHARRRRRCAPRHPMPAVCARHKRRHIADQGTETARRRRPADVPCRRPAIIGPRTAARCTHALALPDHAAASRYRCASSAAMQPVPALVTA